MIKARKASVLVIGAMAAVAVGGGVAFAASGGDDPVTPSRAAVTNALTAELTATPEAGAASATPEAGAGEASATTGTGAPAEQISAAAARSIAVGAAGGGRVTKVERETEHGRAVWDVEVRNGGVEHDIDVDRRTGAVLRHETDRDGASRRHDRSDDRGGRDDSGGDRADDHGGDRANDHGGHGRGGDDDRGDDHGGRGRGGDDD